MEYSFLFYLVCSVPRVRRGGEDTAANNVQEYHVVLCSLVTLWFPLVFSECWQDKLLECHYLLKLIREYANRQSALFNPALEPKKKFYRVDRQLSGRENNSSYVLWFATLKDRKWALQDTLYSAPFYTFDVWMATSLIHTEASWVIWVARYHSQSAAMCVREHTHVNMYNTQHNHTRKPL